MATASARIGQTAPSAVNTDAPVLPAYVPELTVDRLTSGTLRSTTITVGDDGSIQAGVGTNVVEMRKEGLFGYANHVERFRLTGDELSIYNGIISASEIYGSQLVGSLIIGGAIAIGLIVDGSAPFQVSNDGTMSASNALISGTITGSEIVGSQITGGDNGEFRVSWDGSLVAKNATLSGGQLSTNTWGTRIVLGNFSGPVGINPEMQFFGDRTPNNKAVVRALEISDDYSNRSTRAFPAGQQYAGIINLESARVTDSLSKSYNTSLTLHPTVSRLFTTESPAGLPAMVETALIFPGASYPIHSHTYVAGDRVWIHAKGASTGSTAGNAGVRMHADNFIYTTGAQFRTSYGVVSFLGATGSVPADSVTQISGSWFLNKSFYGGYQTSAPASGSGSWPVTIPSQEAGFYSISVAGNVSGDQITRGFVQLVTTTGSGGYAPFLRQNFSSGDGGETYFSGTWTVFLQGGQSVGFQLFHNSLNGTLGLPSFYVYACKISGLPTDS